MTERARTSAAAALFAALVLALDAPTLFSHSSFGGRDLTVYNLPIEKNVHDAYARGRLPVWSPDISGGRPLLPNPNAGALYPVRALLAPIPFALASRIFPLLHWALSGVGMIALLRALEASPSAAWVGAATYVFSGIGRGQVFFPHTHPGVALLPWILWALVRRRTAPLAVFFALDFLAGDVFTAGLAAAAAGAWLLLETPREHRRDPATVLAAGIALGALAALPQIMATALWIPETSRAVQGLRLRDAFFFSIPPVRLLELAVPFPFGPTWELEPTTVWAPGVFRGKTLGLFPTLYCGAFSLAAAVFARRERRAGTRLGFAMVLLGLAVAVPPSLLPESWGSLPSPVALRNPEKMAVAVAFGLSLLAGRAFDRLREERAQTGWMLTAAGIMAAAALVLRLLPAFAAKAASRPELATEASSGLPGAVAIAGLLWMATYAAVGLLDRPRPGAPLAAAALLTAVPVFSNFRIAQTFRQEELFAPTAFARWISRQDPQGAWRALGESLYRPDSPLARSAAGGDRGQVDFARRDWVRYTPSLWGRGTVFNADFDAGDLSRTESLRRLSGLLAGSPQAGGLFASCSLRWGIRFRDQEPLPGYVRSRGDALQDWDELAIAPPDVRFVKAWSERAGPAEAVRALPGLAPGAVVVESGRTAEGAAVDGQARVLEETPERLVAETQSSVAGWVFVLRSYWRHRTVAVDGRQVAGAPAQLAFTAVPVPPGAHRIELSERVPGGRVSWIGPVLFSAMIAWLLLRRDAGSEAKR